eukprot:CAMPEP_0202486092 /NCGR_PEP_ID=MMETSP1361-20130828/4750_1 /ASSEMBLY_ACC=CAM_ASM_000849 /TAXON_ID=210615 /ORGANISM="Staurosira complex sp., Strain CCMP2646" /LENGTH=97 /DNA_ID=CAMNT_0049115135 /DNA_START=73 /DNA_END=366 /DNA_ORIENTATION=+
MTLMAASRMAVSRPSVVAFQQQRRGFVDYLVNYPDHVLQKKAIQCKGGTRLGEANPTWLKQPGDTTVLAFGAALVSFGLLQLGMGYYNLAFNKNKKE